MSVRRLLLRAMPYYAVRRGRKPGIYKTWDECHKQVNRFSKARYKKFATEAEAVDFVNEVAADNWSSPAHCQDAKSKQTQSISKVEVSKLIKDTKSRKRTSRRSRSRSTTPLKEIPERAESVVPRVSVYTDGGCVSNGQDIAQAGIGVYWGPNDCRNVSERLEGRQTNNRAEIHAACRAIIQAKEQGIGRLEIITDSQFLINAATKWMYNWKGNNWKLTNGGRVKNREDFEFLDKISKGINIEWTHVRGHTGVIGNEAADYLANQGALKPLK